MIDRLWFTPYHVLVVAGVGQSSSNQVPQQHAISSYNCAGIPPPANTGTPRLVTSTPIHARATDRLPGDLNTVEFLWHNNTLNWIEKKTMSDTSSCEGDPLTEVLSSTFKKNYIIVCLS